MTPSLRQELIGEESTVQKREGSKPSAKLEVADRESVALWNPDWQVLCPDFEGAPARLTDYAGKSNVLMTHPFSRTEPCALERTVEVPKGQKASLSFNVAADERGDWELRILADGKLLRRRLVEPTGDRWKQITMDLTPFAGRKINLRLENAANDRNYQFGYWTALQISNQ